MSQSKTSDAKFQKFIDNDSEMSSIIRSYDWENSSLGVPEKWPQSLLSLLSTMLSSSFPMLLWWGDDLVQFYNDAYRPSLGISGKHPKALGQTAKDTWPEIWHIIKPQIDIVIQTGQATWHEDQLVPIFRNNRLEDVYWTYSYSLVKDDGGNLGGVLVICNETTEKVIAQQQLEKSVNLLTINQTRLKYLLADAPVAISVLIGEEFIIENANKIILEIWGKTEQIIGIPLIEALPELQGQPFIPLLQEVLASGKPFHGNEVLALLEKDNEIFEMYSNFVYHPLKNADGHVNSIIVVGYDITEQVKARKELEKSKDKLELFITAAELGTFDMDLEKGTMDWDNRCRELFGITHQQPVTYDNDFVNGLHPEDRQRIIEIIDNVMIKAVNNGNYNITYRTIGAQDKKLRWIRAKGKVYFDKDEVPLRFIGSVLDISEVKQEEMRKNDFIALVSHELKTPLTSVKGFTQLLAIKAKEKQDNFTGGILERVNKQVMRMTEMINGFLNLSSLEESKVPLLKKSFDLEAMLKDLINECELTHPDYAIQFLPCKPTFVNADQNKVEQVINNLLSNCIKYSDKNTTIIVSCAIKNAEATVSIMDEGIGIKPNDINKLFDRFYRVENPVAKQVSGFGIGLYLCAEIIRQHNGKIWAESEFGKGSTFYFTLPIN